ncbi:MAG: outer membrane beta-barrel protein [Saprospiraceae bacterium]|nr:outer membrane beta-barrel protein [Saprospiraceae bacterium]
MKKLILLSSMLFSTFFTLSAQSTFGVKAGANLSYVIETSKEGNTSSDQNDLLPGAHIGLFYQTSRTSPIGFRGEVLFSMKGERKDFVLVGGDFDNINFNYISVPLSVIYTPADLLDLELGVEPSFLVSVKPASLEPDSKIDAGVFAGTSVHIGSQFSVGLRYIFGLLNVFEIDVSEGGVVVDQVRLRNRCIQLWAGFSF